MASSISRNWISGLSSGMDTQGLIEKMMQIEHIPIDRLGQKRTTLTFQKTMLQEINLKLFDTQSKATDLMFSRTFSTKKVASTNDRLVAASATTGAQVGSWTVAVKQLATASKLTSTANLAGPIELGEYIQSSKLINTGTPTPSMVPQTIGGVNLPLGPAPGKGLKVTPGDIQISLNGGPVQNLDLSVLTPASTLDDAIVAINGKINLNPQLQGKIKASYDEKNQQLQFTLLSPNADPAVTTTVQDNGGDIINTLFGAASFTLNKNTLVKSSTAGYIHSGLEATIDDYNLSTGLINVTWGGNAQTITTAGMAGTTKLSEVIESLNHQLDTAYGWSGNPDDRQLAFRFDAASRKIFLANRDTSETAKDFDLQDVVAGGFVERLFGTATPGIVVSSDDRNNTLSAETFPSNISPGTITIDGTVVNVNTFDTLQGVMARITSTTSVDAFYDSARDIITFTRKDGTNTAIAVGAASDTSNFLSVTGLISGSQAKGAVKQSSAALGAVDPNLDVFTSLGVTSGSLNITVNGTVTNVGYLNTESLNTILDRIKSTVSGIGSAYYDGTNQKVSIGTSSKGASASLTIVDAGGGDLATKLNMDGTAVVGLNTGTTLEGSHGVSGIKSSVALSSAGFQTAITTGSFTINGTTFTIATTAMTLDSLLATINNNTKVGVKAEYDSSSGKILLTSKQTGSSSINIGASTDTSNFLSAAGLVYGTQDVGKNSIFSVSGILGGADITRQTNEISDVVSGLTLKLKGVTTGVGETIDISADTDVARKAIDDFIKSYNDTMTAIYTKLTEKRDYTLEPLTDQEKSSLSKDEVKQFEDAYKIGLLSGDSTLTSVRGRMRSVVSSMVSGLDSTLKALSDIGITTGAIGSSYQDTQMGILKITDESKLTDALTNNPEKVGLIFGQDSVTESSQGIARRLKNALNEFTKSGGILTSRVGRSGLSISNSEFDKQISLLTRQISDGETRLKRKEDQLLKQFSDLETAMSRYQSQSSAFSQQLAKLGGG